MSFLRSRSETIQAPDYSTRVIENQNGIQSETEVMIGHEYRSMSDVVTANYAKKIKRGDIINNEMVLTHYGFSVEGESSMSKVGIIYPGSWTKITGGSETMFRANQSPPDDGGLAEVEGNCKVRAIAQMDRTPYAFGEDLGEIGETIRFLKNPMKSLDNLTETMRSVAHNRAKYNSISMAKALADVWTTSRFAVMPLVLSMYDLLWAFSDGVNKDRPRLTRLSSRGFDKSEYRHNDEDDSVVSGNVRYTTSREFFSEIDGHASILYTVSNPAAAWRFNLGLRNKDIPLTAWQLVPLSFMVDRVLDISTAIQAALNIADPSLEILAASYRSKQSEKNKFHTHKGDDLGGNYNVTVDGGKLSTENFIYHRRIWKPSVSDISVPFEKAGLIKDVKSIVDLAAIIIQRVT